MTKFQNVTTAPQSFVLLLLFLFVLDSDAKLFIHLPTEQWTFNWAMLVYDKLTDGDEPCGHSFKNVMKSINMIILQLTDLSDWKESPETCLILT